MRNIRFLVLVALVISVGLTSGLLYSFSIAVSPGLEHLSDLEFLRAMKGINKEILNGLFFASFFSPVFLFPVTFYFHRALISTRWLLLLSALLYILVILITTFVNVPINEQLANCDILHANPKGLSQMRYLFEDRWTFWNNSRTVFSTTSFLFLMMSQFQFVN